jgi:biotin carboxylase
MIPARYLALADEVEIVDTNDNAATLARLATAHGRRPLAAVLPGFEHYVPLAAMAARDLGLRAPSVAVAQRFRYKHLMRAALAAAGVRQPRYVLITQQTSAAEAIMQVGLPCVTKPVDQSGSLNVRKADSLADAVAAIRAIREFGAGYLDRMGLPLVLAEEYVAGPEFSVEGYAEDGSVVILGITEKLLGPEPWFVETGHMLPARMDEATTRLVRDYIATVIRALGLELGPFHAELRLTAQGPMLIEVAARLPGDRIPDLLALVTGADLYQITAQAYLGLPQAADREPVATYAGIRFFLQPGLAAYRGARIAPELGDDSRLREIEMLIAAGEPIPSPGGSASRLGYAIAAGPSYEETAEALDSAERGICFVP